MKGRAQIMKGRGTNNERGGAQNMKGRGTNNEGEEHE